MTTHEPRSSEELRGTEEPRNLNRLYAAVLIALAVEVVLFYILTRSLA